jgi:uncharacterized protein YidB (DUF937 family)
MGILDNLEHAAGLGGAASQTGRSPITAILEMLQTQPGGLAGVLEQFNSSGLGAAVSSWQSQGSNIPVSPPQVQGALGLSLIAQIAEKLGLTNEQAAGHLAQLLPVIVNHLSPNGQAPGSMLPELGDLLAQFTRR